MRVSRRIVRTCGLPSGSKSLVVDAVGQDTSLAWQTETDETLDRLMHGALAAEKRDVCARDKRRTSVLL